MGWMNIGHYLRLTKYTYSSLTAGLASSPIVLAIGRTPAFYLFSMAHLAWLEGVGADGESVSILK